MAGKILLQQGQAHGIIRTPVARLPNPRAQSSEPMPTYDYQCQTCGHQFEAKQSMKDPHLTDCPQEGCAGPVKRKIGAGAGFIFKGNGFYITDYRSDSYKAAAKKDSESASASSSSTSASSSTSSSTSSSSTAGAAPAKAGAAA